MQIHFDEDYSNILFTFLKELYRIDEVPGALIGALPSSMLAYCQKTPTNGDLCQVDVYRVTGEQHEEHQMTLEAPHGGYNIYEGDLATLNVCGNPATGWIALVTSSSLLLDIYDSAGIIFILKHYIISVS
jgi:hypothetical protein